MFLVLTKYRDVIRSKSLHQFHKPVVHGNQAILRVLHDNHPAGTNRQDHEDCTPQRHLWQHQSRHEREDCKHGVSPVTFQNKFKAHKTSIRAKSLFDLLTDGIPSSPSGTSKSLPPVPLFTGTNDEQQTAKTAIRLLKEDLKINLMARTKPALLFKSKGLRFPLFEALFFHSPNHTQQTGSQPAQPYMQFGHTQRSIQ